MWDWIFPSGWIGWIIRFILIGLLIYWWIKIQQKRR